MYEPGLQRAARNYGEQTKTTHICFERILPLQSKSWLCFPSTDSQRINTGIILDSLCSSGGCIFQFSPGKNNQQGLGLVLVSAESGSAKNPPRDYYVIK